MVAKPGKVSVCGWEIKASVSGGNVDCEAGKSAEGCWVRCCQASSIVEGCDGAELDWRGSDGGACIVLNTSTNCSILKGEIGARKT